jgi:hypothetical protein
MAWRSTAAEWTPGRCEQSYASSQGLFEPVVGASRRFPLRVKQLHSLTPKGDVIVGTSRKDKISAGKGNDLICARGGKDKVKGGKGKDRLFGEGGRDTLLGQACCQGAVATTVAPVGPARTPRRAVRRLG